MATLTGRALLDQVLESTGATVSELFQEALATRLQAAIDAGITSNLALASVLGANAQILATVPDGEDPLDFLVDEVADAKVVIDEEPETTFTLAEALAAEELPEEYFIVDEAGNLFDGQEFAAGAEAILDGAAGIEIDGEINLGQFHLINDLATFVIENLTFDLADFFENLITYPEAAALAQSYELWDAEGTDFGRVTEEEAAFIEGADNYAEGYWDYTIGEVGETFELTPEKDTIIGTENDDTINGTSATLNATDIILDQYTDDNDTLNLMLTTVNALANISGIENINVDWNAFGTANYDAANTSGATITGTSSKLGFLGNFTVDNTGDNNVVAGAGMTGTLLVDLATDTTVTGTAAKIINVDGSGTRDDNLAADVTAGENTTTIDVGATDGFDAVSVTGGAKTTNITVNDSNAITVDAAAATTVTLDGTAETDDTATVTLGVDADVLLGGTAEIEDVTINAADGTTVDITGSDIKNLMVASDGAVALVAAASELDTNTVTNGTTGLTVEVDHDGAADLSKVAADLFMLTSTHASALTFATGANVLIDEGVDLNAGASFVGKSATTGSLDLTVLNDQTNDIEVTTLKTLNLAVDDQDLDDDGVATLGGIKSANDVNLMSANDVVVTVLDVKNLDASNSTGNLTTTSDFGTVTTKIQSLVGSQGDNDITLDNVDADVSVVTAEGDDKVTFDASAAATGDVTLFLGNGNNEVDGSTTGIQDADLSIVTGVGNDTVNVITDATGGNESNFVAELGDGDNEVTLTTTGTGGDENATVVTGSGADTLIIGADTNATDTIVWTAGGGTDSLDISAADITAGDLTFSGIEQIQFVAAASVVDGALLTGETYKLLGEGTVAGGVFTDQLDVTLALAGSYDFSGLTFGSTLSDGAAGLDITGSGGDDTIVGTSGADVITTATGTHVITGGEGADEIDITVGTKSTVVIADGDTGVTANNVDVITAFTSGTDKLKLGTAGSATNFAEVDATDGISDGTGAADTVAQALAAVTGDGTLDGTVKYAFVFDSDDAHTSGWLVIDFDADGEADGVVELVGLVATGDLVFGDIIA